MRKIKYTNFEPIKDIIITIDFSEAASKEKIISELEIIWGEVTNNKFSKMSRIYDILKDNTIKIVCADSFIANELYLDKQTFLKPMKEKAEKLGIIIRDIKFDYKQWKEKEHD